MTRKRSLALILAVAAVVWVFRQDPGAQTYSSGQNISPAYEGWTRNDDGSFNFLFGYMNRNWQEELDVPVGPDNMIEPYGPDQGQPTHFLPRRNRFIFEVRVPADFGEDRELVWTLTTQGQTEKAYATLRPDYFVDGVVIASETGALGAGTSSPEVRANIAPTVAIEGGTTRTARVGEPLELVAIIKDDGVPRRRGGGGGGAAALAALAAARGAGAGTGDATASSTEATAAAARVNPAYRPPSRNTVGKVTGLHTSWFVYRGAGKVTFDPIQVKPWEDTRAGANSPWAPLWSPPVMPADGRVVARATFSEPGTYVLRLRADDGALYGDGEVTVTVR